MGSSDVVFYSVHSVRTRSGYEPLHYQFNMISDILVITSRLIYEGRRVRDSGSESYLAVL